MIVVAVAVVADETRLSRQALRRTGHEQLHWLTRAGTHTPTHERLYRGIISGEFAYDRNNYLLTTNDHQCECVQSTIDHQHDCPSPSPQTNTHRARTRDTAEPPYQMRSQTNGCFPLVDVVVRPWQGGRARRHGAASPASAPHTHSGAQAHCCAALRLVAGCHGARAP